MMPWVKYMPERCPWCGSEDEPKPFGAGRCNSSWHRSHPQHLLMWPTWVEEDDA